MTEDEWAAFLRHGTRTGKLALALADGRATVTPVWFVLDDDGVLRFTTWHETTKARVLRRDPRACLLVDLEEPPYAFVRVEGEVALVDDLALVRDVARRAAARYMGEDRAEEYAARNGVEGELVAELRITRVVAEDDVSG
jgi:PPOX class probable F420-dependent enzyme